MKIVHAKSSSQPSRTETWEAALQAHQIFTRRHPRWQQSFFDEYFIQTRVIPLLRESAEPDFEMLALCLARLWANQIRPGALEAGKMLDQMKPVMDEYLALVRQEQDKGVRL